MTTVKVASKHWDRQSAIFFGIGMLWMGLLALTFSQIENVNAQRTIAIISFICMVVAIVVVMGKRERQFKCPDCDGPLDEALDTDGKSGTPLLRLCRPCDVLWQTGAVAD